MNPVRVIVVDDSALIRRIFSEMLNDDPDIVVVDTANDPYEAREKIKRLNPDVITLDVEMPKMDGIAFLEKIMTLRPMPVVMVSTLTQKGADTTLRALEIGAVDCVPKPTDGDPEKVKALQQILTSKVKAAARAKVRAANLQVAAKPVSLSFQQDPARSRLIFIGASTGGVEAIREVLKPLPANIPPILITQHMPAGFTRSFAERMDRHVAPAILEAEDGIVIRPGHVYIAPGDFHLKIGRRHSQYLTILENGPEVSGHRPSVDVLFDSAAEVLKSHAVGVILTGMGKDGAKGLLRMKQAGAATIGQDEASSLIYGMPKAAFELGGVNKQMPLAKISEAMLQQAAEE